MNSSTSLEWSPHARNILQRDEFDDFDTCWPHFRFHRALHNYYYSIRAFSETVYMCVRVPFFTSHCETYSQHSTAQLRTGMPLNKNVQQYNTTSLDLKIVHFNLIWFNFLVFNFVLFRFQTIPLFCCKYYFCINSSTHC